MLFALSRACVGQPEDSRRVEQRYVEQWPAEQKKGLASGERSDVHFYSTSNTDVLIRHFAGMPEIKRLTFQLTDLTDEGVKVVAGHYAFLRSRTGKGVSELERCADPFRCPVWAKTAELADERERRIRSAGGGWPLGRRLVRPGVRNRFLTERAGSARLWAWEDRNEQPMVDWFTTF